MNRVILIGSLTRAVEVRKTRTDLLVSNFTLAVNREIKEGEADFISCVAYGKQAELVSKYLDKGSKISVEGHIQTGSYEKDGRKVYTTDVVVEKIQFLDSKK